jgi:serine-type D-Ala-D-Ala carboxypeptidase/endopeptidase (penicillin-binding protein 4)
LSPSEVYFSLTPHISLLVKLMTRLPRFGLLCSTLALTLSSLLGIPAATLATPQETLEQLFPGGRPITPDPNYRGYNPNLSSPYLCPRDLEGAIGQIIDSHYFSSARWGILIETLSPRTVLYSRNPDSLLVPASNVKLLTTAAALRTLYRENLNLDGLSYRMAVINRHSDNYVADALLHRMGGVSTVQAALTPLGIDPSGYRQVDGSGLSRGNLASPSTLVAVLRAMHNSEARQLFAGSLPVAGYSGTLKNRFRNTTVQGRLRAKTGTLDGVRALSGYLDHPSYGPVLVSVVVNQPGQSGEMLLWGIDSVMLQLMRVQVCSQNLPAPSSAPEPSTSPQLPGRVR